MSMSTLNIEEINTRQDMVVCQYFLQGRCKFGDNCRNEHRYPGGKSSGDRDAPMDPNVLLNSVRQDVTNAEKGGMWVFSQYAPFRDKTFFPGFEDTSFEEVRLKFYEAKQTGTEEQCKQEYQRAWQTVIGKIRALQNPNAEAQKLIVDIYNTPAYTGVTFSETPTLFQSGVSNPFASNNSFNTNKPNMPSVFAVNQSSSFGTQNTGTSIFGGSAAAATNQPAFGQSSVFGAPSTFGSQATNSSSSIFGSGGQTNQTTGQSVFGQNSSVFSNQVVKNSPLFSQQGGASTNANPFASATPSGPSIFSGQTQSSTNSVFGQQQQQNTGAFSGSSFTTFRDNSASSGGSIFGAKPPTSTSASSIFANAVSNLLGSQGGQQTTPFGSQPPAFGSTAPGSFGNTPQQTASFGAQPNAFGSQPAQSTSSVFNTQPAQSNSVFGSQTTQNTAFAQPSAFGTIPTTQQSIFGSVPPNVQASAANTQQQSIFGTTPNVQATNSSSVFGMNQQTNTNAVNQSIFGTPATTSNSNANTNTQSVFGAAQPTSVFGNQTSSSSSNSVFGSNQSTVVENPAQNQTASKSIFGQNTTTPSSGSIFGQPAASHSASIFGSANLTTTTVDELTKLFTDEFYSKLEDLNEEENEVFKADKFEMGKIPIKPPPRELCF